jgi:hypothetical protein
MSGTPGSAPTSDSELRLTRSALAWEIRKFRLDARVLGALLGFAGVMYNNYATQRAAQRHREVQSSLASVSGSKDSAGQIEEQGKAGYWVGGDVR